MKELISLIALIVVAVVVLKLYNKKGSAACDESETKKEADA